MLSPRWWLCPKMKTELQAGRRPKRRTTASRKAKRSSKAMATGEEMGKGRRKGAVGAVWCGEGGKRRSKCVGWGAGWAVAVGTGRETAA